MRATFEVRPLRWWQLWRLLSPRRWWRMWRLKRVQLGPEVDWTVGDDGYVRPPITPPVCLDDQGRVIDFGRRWGMDGPPVEAYSVVHHPERFAPLVEVAQAMVEHLARTYDVTVEDITDLDGEREPKWRPDPAETDERPVTRRAVAITPQRGDAARLIVVWSSFPGVELWAGAFFREAFPDCGCDACDEEWSVCADQLEQTALAVALGSFSEKIKGRRLETRLRRPGSSSGGTSRLKDQSYSAARIARARRLLAARPTDWQPWPRRPAAV